MQDSHQSIQSPGQDVTLVRDLGLLETVSIVIGRIIGSGIFRTPAPIFALVGSGSLFFGVWIFGGLVTMLGAFCVMEMVAMMPRSGGPYAFLKAAYPPVWTFLRGWAMFFVAETGAIAAVALVFAEYSSFFFEQSIGFQLSTLNRTILAIILIWLLTAANCFGVFLSGKFQVVFSAAKLIALITIIVCGITQSPQTDHFLIDWWPKSVGWETFLAFFAAMRYGFFAYSGWEGATYVAEEVKNPTRNLPLSLLIGISGVMLLYMAANVSYLLQLTPGELQVSKYVAGDAMRRALGATGGLLIAVAVMVNTFGNVGTQILVKARTWHAMARDGMFFSPLAKLSETYKTPNTALIVQAIWATLLVLFASMARNAYESVIDFFTFTASFFNVMMFGAIFILRRRFPDMHRPFRVPFYPIPVIIACLVYATLMLTALITAPVQSLLGVGLTATGLLYYWYVRRSPVEPV
ncbi:MAG: amino acid permease [Leptospirales bacterium]|nr:amino acid permease [Leptospirales bacterium]